MLHHLFDTRIALQDLVRLYPGMIERMLGFDGFDAMLQVRGEVEMLMIDQVMDGGIVPYLGKQFPDILNGARRLRLTGYKRARGVLFSCRARSSTIFFS
jgi:hypothetical protein